jgi:hypothetical protein
MYLVIKNGMFWHGESGGTGKEIFVACVKVGLMYGAWNDER